MRNDDFITITQATEVSTSLGERLSRSQIHHLCKTGKLVAEKVGTVWLVSRKSIEVYKPEKTGFAAVWEKRRSEQDALDNEIRKAVAKAKGTPSPVTPTVPEREYTDLSYVAELAGVSEDTVSKYIKIKEKASPELMEEVLSGKKEIETAYREVQEGVKSGAQSKKAKVAKEDK